MQGSDSEWARSQVEIAFHGTDYLLTVTTTNGETLSVEIEQRMDASRWRGDFTSSCACAA